MAEIINLGSLRFNGKPKTPGVKYNGEAIAFGDTIPGMAIPFVKWGKLLVACQCVCIDVSWMDMKNTGYIFGRPIKIDGTLYLCRSLKAGEVEGAPNEWDDILDDLGDDNSLWSWERMYFWGQEVPTGYRESRTVRGYTTSRGWGGYLAASRYEFVGFRPVLEPLDQPSSPLVSNSLIGADLRLYGPDAAVVGQLVAYNEYDILMVENPEQPFPSKCRCARRNSDCIIIDRSAIVWLKEE